MSLANGVWLGSPALIIPERSIAVRHHILVIGELRHLSTPLTIVIGKVKTRRKAIGVEEISSTPALWLLISLKKSNVKERHEGTLEVHVWLQWEMKLHQDRIEMGKLCEWVRDRPTPVNYAWPNVREERERTSLPAVFPAKLSWTRWQFGGELVRKKPTCQPDLVISHGKLHGSPANSTNDII